MNAVVIVVEGVGAGQLGPYGSPTSTTPAIDRLAARSLVLDQCFVDAHDLASQLNSLWTAGHASASSRSDWNLWRHLRELNVPMQLITDSPVAAALAEEFGLDNVTLVDVDPATEPAVQSEDCNLMQLFATAIQVLSHDETQGVVWIHSKGLRHAWDAPIELRQAMVDPEDPEPPESVQLPMVELDEDSDPDLVVGWGQVAAAQVAVLDQAIDAVEQAVEDRMDGDSWAWLMCSLGGTPLGEHGWLGKQQQQGYSEEVAAAFIVRAADMPMVGLHRAELCQLPDVPVTLLAAMQIELPSSVWGRSLLETGAPRPTTQWPPAHSLVWIDGQHPWVRTPAWSLVATGQQQFQLFVKPDDRWEASDVAMRRDDIVEQLRGLLPDIRSAVESGNRDGLPKLDEQLTSLKR